MLPFVLFIKADTMKDKRKIDDTAVLQSNKKHKNSRKNIIGMKTCFSIMMQNMRHVGRFMKVVYYKSYISNMGQMEIIRLKLLPYPLAISYRLLITIYPPPRI